MTHLLRSARRTSLCLAWVLLTSNWTTSATAATLWNETVSGDLSNDQAAPNALGLSLGANSIIGSVGGLNQKDFVALTVPAGDVLTSIILTVYSSSDVQGFTGVQAGASFVGNPQTASPYLGYAHFGTGAINGNLPKTNLIGQDLLPLMGNNTLAVGSAGFTPPLPAGTYTFLIQQLGSNTTYQFDYNVAQVPEPATIWLLAIGVVGFAICARNRMTERTN